MEMGFALVEKVLLMVIAVVIRAVLSALLLANKRMSALY
jgi:cell division protein FtsL